MMDWSPDFALVVADKQMLLWAPFSQDKLESGSTRRTRNARQEVQHGSHLSLHQLSKHQDETLQPNTTNTRWTNENYKVVSLAGCDVKSLSEYDTKKV